MGLPGRKYWMAFFGTLAAWVVDATCTPDTVDENGVGKYRCMIDFADKSRASYVVTVGADGKWVTD